MSPRRPVIEPRKRQHLDPGIKIAAKIEDDALLEVIVEQDAEAVEQILGEEGRKPRGDQGDELFRMMLLENHLDDPLCHGREDRHHERTDDGAEHGGHSHPGITGRVTEDAEQNAHAVL